MIEVSHVTKRYRDKTALSDVSLRIEAGEIFGIIGESGAGKSSLLRCLNLLEAPSAGTVTVAGCDLTRLDKRALRQARHKIGMIFQHFNLVGSQTVYDNIALPLRFQKQSKEAIREKVLPLLNLVGLTQYEQAYPSQLSGGQKQRVAIARALVSEPGVLLCDEATSALDPQTTESILSLLRDINQKFHLTIVMITHEMEVVKQICDRVAVLEKGQLKAVAKTTDYFYGQSPSLPTSLTTVLRPEAGPEHYPICVLHFRGKVVTHPLIYQFAREHDIPINILQAQMNTVVDETLGAMVVALHIDKYRLSFAIERLEVLGVKVEVLGYVPSDVV